MVQEPDGIRILPGVFLRFEMLISGADTVATLNSLVNDASTQQLYDDNVRETVGVGVEVEVLDPGALERSLGKAKRISDRR